MLWKIPIFCLMYWCKNWNLIKLIMEFSEIDNETFSISTQNFSLNFIFKMKKWRIFNDLTKLNKKNQSICI